MQPRLVARGDGLACIQPFLRQPGMHSSLHRVIVDGIALAGSFFKEVFSLVRAVCALGVGEGNTAASHLVGPELGVGGEVGVPVELLDAHCLTGLVHHGDTFGYVADLGHGHPKEEQKISNGCNDEHHGYACGWLLLVQSRRESRRTFVCLVLLMQWNGCGNSK